MFIPQLAASGLGLLAQIPSMVNQFQVAKEQKKRAGELQEEAKNVKKREIRPEFMTALNEAELLAQSGMPTYGAAKQNIDANSANALRSIREASPYGGVTADAISAVLTNQNKELTNLDATQGQFKLGNRQNAIQELKGVGAEQERLTQEQLEEKRRIMASAEALLQAGTANKQNALETVGSTVAGLGTALGKGISAGSDISVLKDKLASGNLTQSEFDAMRKNTLFGTNATGNNWMSSVANIGKGGNVGSNVGAQLGSIASSATTPQVSTPQSTTGNSEIVGTDPRGVAMTRQEVNDLMGEYINNGLAKDEGEVFELLRKKGFKL